jgi:hypothetical protein
MNREALEAASQKRIDISAMCISNDHPTSVELSNLPLSVDDGQYHHQQPHQQLGMLSMSNFPTPRVNVTSASSPSPSSCDVTSHSHLTVTDMEHCMAKARISLSFQERTRAMEDLHGVRCSRTHAQPEQQRQPHLDQFFQAMKERILESSVCEMADQEEWLQWAFLHYVKADFPVFLAQEDTDHDQHDKQRILFQQKQCIVEQAARLFQTFMATTVTTDAAITPTLNTPNKQSLLSVEELAILYGGCFQKLPCNDQAGRTVLAIVPKRLPSDSSAILTAPRLVRSVPLIHRQSKYTHIHTNTL